MTTRLIPQIHFSECFGVSPAALESYGAFNISLINDLPLFIDPFLLFNSRRSKYQALHESIIKYLRFLRDQASRVKADPGLISSWYTFPEFKQTWLGFSDVGNSGRGLGLDFAAALRNNLHTVFAGFGKEKVAHGSHLEKLTLVREGVGKDKISDFTANLIKSYLLEYTQTFTKAHVRRALTATYAISRASFNYKTESWETRAFTLPSFNHDFVVLTPKDMLTKEETWINKTDLIHDFDQIVESISNLQLRAQLNNYFAQVLPRDATEPQRRAAAIQTIDHFPQIIDYYILYKEERADSAHSVSEERVAWSTTLFVDQTNMLAAALRRYTPFYDIPGNTYTEARARLEFLKDVIENKGGWRIFYVDGRPIEREKDLHILYRLTWASTPSDISREADDGRGPADFKVSRGSTDKTIVEFKLASNSQLRRNLEHQAEIYKKASDAHSALKVIIYFTEAELHKVAKILDDLGLTGKRNVVLIDARFDNKPSGSAA